jgi:uncharacterized protein YbjT (DUF2867 family)
MTGAPDHHEAAESRTNANAPVQYPANHVLGVVDTRDQADAVRAALTSGGFLESEIQVDTGAVRADEVDASTGRRGIADLLIRFAERIGATDEEMETKNVYERAMRDNRFVMAIATPTTDRKEQAARILADHSAHSVAYFGKHTIEHIVPPNRRSDRE